MRSVGNAEPIMSFVAMAHDYIICANRLIVVYICLRGNKLAASGIAKFNAQYGGYDI